MKKHKLISSLLAAAIASSSIGMLSAIAEENPVVYTYTNDSGETVNITQSEIDAGHWNVDALGGTAPIVYEDFPVKMDSYVDDFANLSLGINYLKTSNENDIAYITITDMFTDDTVYTADLTEGLIYTNNLDMNGYYQIKITEQFEGEAAAEYTHYISTAYNTADMPDYVINPQSDEEDSIYIIDTEKFTIAETVDEDGREFFDADAAEFTEVKANEWNEYISELPANKVYKVVTGIGRSMKTGFISTYSWGESLGVFIPDYTLYSEDVSSIPMATVLSPTTDIPDAVITGAEEYETYMDLTFTTSNYYKVIQYTLNNNDCEDGEYYLNINASDGFYYMIWYKWEGTSTIIKDSSVYSGGRGNVRSETLLPDSELNEGDTVYFVIYSANSTNFSGSLYFENKIYNDDITGSAYTRYATGSSVSCATYTSGFDYDAAEAGYSTSGKLKNYWDADCFYINNTADFDSGYTIMMKNNGYTNNSAQGTNITVAVYYVDFTDDNHFVLKYKSASSVKNGVEKGINFSPTNENTKYFFYVMESSEPISNLGQMNYSFYTIFYPEA